VALVFSEVDGVSIAVDVYIPEKATKEEQIPILLWWHGSKIMRR
jgi:predicted acyl esterase